jgi:hypothetical protein
MSVKVTKYNYRTRMMPDIPGYHNILVHTSGCNVGGDLSPFVLTDDKGRLLENVWQFAKVYSKVHPQNQFNRYSGVVTWHHPGETHVDNNDVLTPGYFKWRERGMTNEYPVRYPNGYKGKDECLYCLWENERLGYIEARKRVYCGEYIKYHNTPHFKQLKNMLNDGVNLNIVEVDGPNTALQYPPYNQIGLTNPGMDINEENVRMLLNDPRNPFGHGYVIATLLLGHPEWLL